MSQAFNAQAWGEAWRDGASGCKDAAPIFIVGLPRCGSTLIEQVLSAHPQVAPGGENTAFAPLVGQLVPLLQPGGSMDVFEVAGQRYVDTMKARCFAQAQAPQASRAAPAPAPPQSTPASAAPAPPAPPAPAPASARAAAAARFTDKMLGNFWNLGFVRLALPNAKIVHAVRSPMDQVGVCYSAVGVRPTCCGRPWTRWECATVQLECVPPAALAHGPGGSVLQCSWSASHLLRSPMGQAGVCYSAVRVPLTCCARPRTSY
jgi:hypothetical protein